MKHKCFSNVRGRGHWNVHLSINFWELVAIQSANSHKLSSWFNGLSICATTHKKINKHEYLILNLGWHLLRSNKRHLTYNLNLIKQEMKMPKITNFFVPKIYSLFSCCAYSHLFVHLFGARLWTSYSMSRLFKKVFASWPLSDIKKRQRKSSGPRANRTNKKKSNKIGCAHSESLIKTLTMTWN